jgi:glycosyltransferase involved in cell wall biosynthesis
MTNSSIHPLISIVLPTYNRAALILETIESVRIQTYSNWELIIVDDGSDDNTEEVIQKIHDDRVSFYKAGRIGIRSKIKNIGIAKAAGELIAFIDSDDLWERTKLEKQVLALQQYPEAGFCLTGGYNFKKAGEPFEFFYVQRTGNRYGDILIPLFNAEVAVFNQALLVRRDCIIQAGNFKETVSVSDVDFVLSLATKYKAIIIYEPLFFRRLHDTNYSSVNRVRRHYEGIKLLVSYKDKVPSKIVRKALFRSHIHFGEDCLNYKEYKMAVASFFRAWRQKPLSIIPFKKIAKALLASSKRK